MICWTKKAGGIRLNNTGKGLGEGVPCTRGTKQRQQNQQKPTQAKTLTSSIEGASESSASQRQRQWPKPPVRKAAEGSCLGAQRLTGCSARHEPKHAHVCNVANDARCWRPGRSMHLLKHGLAELHVAPCAGHLLSGSEAQPARLCILQRHATDQMAP